MENLFIKTFDAETAAKLKAAGFKVVNESTNQWTFLNDSHLRFDFQDKCIKSNKLEI